MLLLLVHNEQKRLILQDKMDTLVNDKLTYEPLKHMVALQWRLNNKLPYLTSKWLTPLTCKFIADLGTLNHNQPNSTHYLSYTNLIIMPMWTIVLFCGSLMYQLSKHLSSILRPFTDECTNKITHWECHWCYQDDSRDTWKPQVSILCLFSSIPLQLALDYTKTAIKKSFFNHHYL